MLVVKYDGILRLETADRIRAAFGAATGLSPDKLLVVDARISLSTLRVSEAVPNTSSGAA